MVVTTEDAASDFTFKAEVYPGLPGSEGFVEAAEIKYERVVKALGICNKTANVLKEQIMAVDQMTDVAELQKLIIRAGVEGTTYLGSA